MDPLEKKKASFYRFPGHPLEAPGSPEDLVAWTASLCAAAQIGNFETALRQVLERIGTFFQGDRCFACEMDEACQTAVLCTEWHAASRVPGDSTGHETPADLSESHLKRLQAGDIIQLIGPAAIAAPASRSNIPTVDRRILSPAICGGAMVGVIGVDRAEDRRPAHQHEIGLLRTLSEIIAMAWRCALSEKRRRLFQRATEQVSDLVLITDGSGKIEYVNPAVEDVTGYASGELIGRNPRVLKSGCQQPAFYRDLWQTISAGQSWRGSFTNRRKCGTLYTEEAVIMPVANATGAICNYIGVKREVTRESTLQQQLVQSQKLEAIGTLAGGIAHDFNNILSAIMGYAELAACEMPQDSPGRRDVSEVIKAGNRAKDLVRQILAFSRKVEQELKPIRVVPMIKEALKFLRASLPSTIEIRTLFSAVNDRVLCTPMMIQQILLNLCTNAAQAMKDADGLLEVSLTNADVGADGIEAHPNLAAGAYVRLTVSDTGPGIEPHVLARIFDPYFTTKEKSEGTGLGLSVVHGIIQALKGSVTVETRPGDGARFHVYLPCNVGKDEPHIMQHNALPTGDERVLFLDDEDVLADMGKQMLEHLGYRVTVMTDSGEALKTFRSRPQDFDLIISDKTMPHMTGFLLTEKIKKIRPDIPVILCTGYCDDIEVERAAAVGVGRLVMKPLGMQALAEAVRCVLDSAETQA